jgi:uncharacterized protein
MGTEFTWGAEKAKRNLRKHGISFETAKQVFFDPYVVILEDCEEDNEVRYHAIGYTGSGPLLVAVFVDRSDDEKEIIRIISAGEAEQYEQRTYTRQFEEGN